MKKFIVNQSCEIIRGVSDDIEIIRDGDTIYIVGYPLTDTPEYQKELKQVQIEEDIAGIGLKKHLIELGSYDSEERAVNVMILLIRWLRGLDRNDPVFIMPECDQRVFFDGKGRLIYHNTDLLSDLGEPENAGGTKKQEQGNDNEDI